MEKDTTFVGIDAHKDSLRVAMLLPEDKEPSAEWELKNDLDGHRRLVKKLKKDGVGRIVCGYEAGPTGYTLRRYLGEHGVECQVVAPSLIPVKPGERIKTDRRDARKLAMYLRAGTLTEVRLPTTEEEAVRDLCRAREDAKQDLTRSQHRLSKFLLRSGLLYSAGKKNWTKKHHEWLRGLRFENPFQQETFDSLLVEITHQADRVSRLEGKIEEVSLKAPYARPVGLIRCLRGFDTLSAMTVLTELHGFPRFQFPRHLMGYLGVVPREWSSGLTRRQGGITKAGNMRVRRILIEAAWHYRHPPYVSRILSQRRKDQPGWAIAIAEKAQKRLYSRYWYLFHKDKAPGKVVTAIARELTGFIWAILHTDEMLAAKGA